MSEEKLIEEKTVEQTQLEKIEEMKLKMDAMVDPDDFKNLKADYDKLLDEYINKRPAPKKKEKVLRPVADIAKELHNIKSGDMSNRDYIKKSLEYREAHIKEFGKDPWTNFSTEGSDEATPTTNKVAQGLQTLLDENESPVDFRIKMNSMMKDDPGLMRKLQKNKR